jgi:malonate-semialdehyde dehydrogenase (acetylating)/methylmalonate-semialdehyde dehydrogenase
MAVLSEVKAHYGKIKNYVDGVWIDSSSEEILDIMNPATGRSIGEVPLSTNEEVESAIQAAKRAFPDWSATPPMQRVQYLYKLKDLMEGRFEDLARTIVQEEGKAIDEARGEVRRAIESVEVACGIPMLMMGRNLEDISRGIDEYEVRQPLGVFCSVSPFNFPGMIPYWFMPNAVACGNTYIVKPSEQVPLTQNLAFQLIQEAGFPPGVINLVNGAKGTVDTLLESQDVCGISFVGSTAVAKEIYTKASTNGKRAQCQAGAKNFLVVMPDADLDLTVDALINSCFGSSGQRCLAGSVVVTVGDIAEPLKSRFLDAASRLTVGYGLDEDMKLGPVISTKHAERVHGYIEKGIKEGARLVLDGRNPKVKDYLGGNFIGATVFDEVKPDMVIAKEEIFGPVASVIHVQDIGEAISIIDANHYGNSACIFTSSGGWAREFQHRVRCGNIGINIGVPAPVALFPFSGMKDSFFGDLHGQGMDGINFFTERKVIVTRWSPSSMGKGWG